MKFPLIEINFFKFSYYGGHMSRDEAAALLNSDTYAGPGHFLVRYSEKEKKHVLSSIS